MLDKRFTIRLGLSLLILTCIVGLFSTVLRAPISVPVATVAHANSNPPTPTPTPTPTVWYDPEPEVDYGLFDYFQIIPGNFNHAEDPLLVLYNSSYHGYDVLSYTGLEVYIFDEDTYVPTNTVMNSWLTWSDYWSFYDPYWYDVPVTGPGTYDLVGEAFDVCGFNPHSGRLDQNISFSISIEVTTQTQPLDPAPPLLTPTPTPTATPLPDEIDTTTDDRTDCVFGYDDDGNPVVTCNPIDAGMQRKHERVTDISIPSAHGLSMDLTRRYSSQKSYSKNIREGNTHFSWPISGKTGSHWTLDLFETSIEKAVWTERRMTAPTPVTVHSGPVTQRVIADGQELTWPTGVTAYCYVYDLDGVTVASLEEHVLAHVSEGGGVTYFDYDTTQQYESDTLLHHAWREDWDKNVWATRFKPVEPGFMVNRASSARPLTRRQTNQDVEIYMLHPYPVSYAQPQAQAMVDYSQVPKFQTYGSVYYAPGWNIGTTFWPWGYQFIPRAFIGSWTIVAQKEPDLTHMGCDGYLVRFHDGRQYHYDKDGRLIVYDLNWRNNLPFTDANHVDDYLKITWSGARIVTVEAAPKTDGRKLAFSYNGYGALDHVDLKMPTGQGTDITNLVRYGYHTAGHQTGKLKTVRPKNDNDFMTQYEYGDLDIDVSYNEIFLQDSPSGKDPKLAIVSKVKGGDVRFEKAIKYNYAASYEPFHVTEEWLFDSVEGEWRKYQSFSANTVTYEAGEKINGTGQYPGAANNVQAINTFNEMGDIKSTTYSSGSSPQARKRRTYIEGSRRVRGIEVLVGSDPENEDHWTTETVFNYSGSNPNPVEIKRYTDVEEDDDVFTAINPILTTYQYANVDFPQKPTTITDPQRNQTVIDYDTLGRPDFVTQKKFNTDTMSTDTLQTTDYAYYSSGIKTGMLHTVTVEPTGLDSHVTTYDYYTANDYANGEVAGQVSSVSVDSGKHVSTYKYNAIGQIKEVETDGEVTTYNYSSTDYPAKLTSVVDPLGTTSYSYDYFGRVNHVTNPASQTTDYFYDIHDNVIEIDAPDNGGDATTAMKYDIYGRLTLLTDAEGNGTVYTYDEFNRQKSESAFGDDTGTAGYGDQTPLYTIEYAYSGWGSGCGSCGGNANSQIAQRKIINGANTSQFQTIDFTYDYMGRLKTQLDSESNRQVEYFYDGLKLDYIDHDGGLWADDRLSFEYNDKYGRLTREIYPNGRYTEFAYDSARRLDHVKDPFGFVNKLTYDSNERLWKLKHSALGESVMLYNTNDLLSSLTLGNGAKTHYAYDAHRRLTSFDHLRPNSSRILKHAWYYDSLGRKSGPEITSGLAGWDPAEFTIGYDSASRLINEALEDDLTSDIWENDYAYDKTGNRTSVATDSISKTLTYGAGNRETGVSGGGTPLSYDYKGNVTVRPPLAGGNAFNYTWDAYDRLVSVSRTGQSTVDYAYDALGRMLLRDDAGSTPTVKYWLGLAPLAEEEWGRESGQNLPVFRPDPETGTNPITTERWGKLGWSSTTSQIEYATDGERGKVVRMWSTDANSAVYMLGDNAANNWNNWNSQTPPWNDDSARKHLGCWLKPVGTTYVILTVCVRTVDSGQVERERFINILTNNWTPYMSGGSPHLTVGPLVDGAWQYFELDLEAQLHRLLPDESIIEMNGLAFNSKEVYVDDIVFSGGRVKRSYQVVPGAAIGGVLGSWTGPLVVADNNNRTRYFHYNDLGTVQAQTKADGTVEGVWEPDFFGNYEGRWAYAGSPSRPELGLTGQIYDSATGGYMFRYRWYDLERGRWLSEEPEGLDRENLFEFNYSDPVTYYDDNGLSPHKPKKNPKGSKKRLLPDHQKGMARVKKERSGTKNNPVPRKRPKGWKGSWPPKSSACFLGLGLFLEPTDLGASNNFLPFDNSPDTCMAHCDQRLRRDDDRWVDCYRTCRGPGDIENEWSEVNKLLDELKAEGENDLIDDFLEWLF